jgi:hypothetical protein
LEQCGGLFLSIRIVKKFPDNFYNPAMGNDFVSSGFAPGNEAVKFAPKPRGGNRQGGKPGAKLGFHVLRGLGELIDLVGVGKIHGQPQIFTDETQIFNSQFGMNFHFSK